MVPARYSAVLLIVLLIAANVSYAIILEVEANVAIESLPGNNLLTQPRDLMRQYAEQTPSELSFAVAALNYDLAIEKGFQYSYPVTFVFELGEDSRIKRYRAEFAEPVIKLMDPSFTPDNPLIEFRYEVVIIEANGKRYVAAVNTKDGTKAEWLDAGLTKKNFRSIDVVELWTDALNLYHELVAGNRIPNLKTAQFERYNLPEFTAILSSDRRSMDYFPEPATEPDSYGRLILQSNQMYVFPVLFEESSKNQRINIYFTISRLLDEAEATSLFEIPEAEVLRGATPD